MRIRHLCLLAVVAGIAACSSVPKPEAPATVPAAPGSPSVAPPPGSSKYYLDDGPGDRAPANLDVIPDAVPRPEPLHR
ncbi:MAG TPA: septal ring lytic transglycosylase RlpA family protein, partial [Casimicrobiaceae bacterium]|nr:septal ring lytic transglycosylase RlpA family protein [Casimicrobiaceae bacterium]